MPYPALPASRRQHYEIDGTIAGYNENGGFGAGMSTVWTAGNLATLNNERGQLGLGLGGTHILYVFFLFPELVDLTFFMCRNRQSGAVFQNFAGSPDTTTGADGTWTAITTGSGTAMVVNAATDWWRSTAPVSCTANNTGLRGVRFDINGNDQLDNIFLWGNKTAGQTPNDIIFLESDGVTEWPIDDDYGDIGAGTSNVVHTGYVKNASASLTANTITVKISGSDSSKWQASLDGVSYGSSVNIASLAPGASTLVYYRFVTPAAGSGVFRPYACYLEADVVSWS